MYWAHPLDSARGCAVNPMTNKQWFDILEMVLAGDADSLDDRLMVDMDTLGTGTDLENGVPILQKNSYAADESGFMAAGSTREQVIGAKGKTTQHQQGDGGCENTTVIVTICADGTSLKPAVIFKGQAFQVKWDQDNLAEASLGHLKKGWNNGEIGIEWIKDFDKQTRRKASG